MLSKICDSIGFGFKCWYFIMEVGKISLERRSVADWVFGSGIDDIGKLRSVMGTNESGWTMSGNSVGLQQKKIINFFKNL